MIRVRFASVGDLHRNPTPLSERLAMGAGICVTRSCRDRPERETPIGPSKRAGARISAVDTEREGAELLAGHRPAAQSDACTTQAERNTPRFTPNKRELTDLLAGSRPTGQRPQTVVRDANRMTRVRARLPHAYTHEPVRVLRRNVCAEASSTFRAMSDAGEARARAMTSVDTSTYPARSGLVLIGLILVAAVANLNLAVANVALPDIGKAFDASQTELDLVAVSYSLGLAASVLYLGALGDRYGRKMMLVVGVVLSVPACLLAAWAPLGRRA